MSQSVELDRVTMRFGAATAVRDVSLEIRAGEFFSILGPSGCGKTTILRLVSGFAAPSSGRVLIGGKDMAGIGPNRRPTALIFQNLALFPLMSVGENVAFGLEVRGVPKAERERRARDLLALVALPDAADMRVDALSGGMKQRVAIARALAVEPQVMLLDEPLSALDLKLRQHMRAELRAIQRRTGVTFLYITHDQGEALTMSDRIAVMARGVVEQVGTPAAIYDRPESPFVAGFVGETNALPGRVVSVADGLARLETARGPLAGRAGPGLMEGAAATLFVRPERARLAATPPADGQSVPAVLLHVDFEGSFAMLVLAGADGGRLAVQHRNDGTGLPPEGASVHLAFAPQDAVVLATAAEG